MKLRTRRLLSSDIHELSERRDPLQDASAVDALPGWALKVDRQRAGRIEARARLRIADLRTVVPGIEGVIDVAAQAAAANLIDLVTDTSVTGTPDAPDVLRAIALALPTIIDNSRRHSHSERCRMAIQADRHRIVVTLSDAGTGFEPSAATWSPHTIRTVFEGLAAVGGDATVTSERDGRGAVWRLSWPAP